MPAHSWITQGAGGEPPCLAPNSSRSQLGMCTSAFIFVAAVAHHGIDEAGHLQALGLGAGWMMFDDLRGSGCCIRTAPETVVLRSFPVKVRRSISHAKTQHFVHPLSFNNAFRTRLPSKMQVADV